MGQAANQAGSLIGQVLPQDDGNRFRMPDLPPAGGMGVNYGYTPNGMAMPSSMGMPNLNLQAPEFGIVDPTYLAQLAILNQGGGNFMPAAAPAAPMGLLGAGLESQDQFRANAPLLGGAPMIADRRAYSPNRSANGLLNQMIAADRSSGGNGVEQSAWSQMSPAEQAAYYNQNPTMAAITQAGQRAFSYAMPGLAAAQRYLAPDFVRDQEMIAMGLNPNQNFGQGFDYGYDYDSFASDRVSPGQGYMADNSIEFGPAPSSGLGYMADNSIEMGPTISPGQGYMADNSIESSQGTNDGTYCCSRMVDLNLWSEHKQLARMHVWHHKQAKWWRAGYSVWGKVVANTLFKKKGFWTDVMDDFYNYHVKNKPRTLKSTVGDLVIYPGVAVCSLFVQEAPATTRYVAQ
jgi:hypothetical protein